MKNRYSIRLLVTVFLSAFAMSICYLCSDDDGEGVKVCEYREQMGKKIKASTDLQTGPQSRLREGTYPETSRVIPEDVIAKLKDFLRTIKEAEMVEARIPKETARLLRESDEKIVEFKTVVRMESLPVPAELGASGENGGYIDFGARPEHSTFDGVGKQASTVEFWIKSKDVEGFFYLISTFTDDDTNNHERKGWCVSSYSYGGNNICMTYGMGFNDLVEPAFGFTTVNEWVYLVVVTDETGIGGKVNEDKPVMTKMYMNGELKLPTTSHQDASEPYASNDSNVPMVALGSMNATDNRIDDEGANGSMKHPHIWCTAKAQDEIRRLMEHPGNVTDEEDDLVCGWTLTKMALDDQEIKDLIGEYTVKLAGDYGWIELE